MKILEVTLNCNGHREKGAIHMDEIEAILPSLVGSHSLVYTPRFPDGLQVEEKAVDLYVLWWNHLEEADDED